jgi:hypothetical protein
MAEHRKSDQRRDDPCAGGLRKRVQDLLDEKLGVRQSRRSGNEKPPCLGSQATNQRLGLLASFSFAFKKR